MNNIDDNVSALESKYYMPGPGEPELPPQLSELAGKDPKQVLAEFNRMPFFMNTLDDTDGAGGENVQLEALRSLAYDGTPEEVATNFKNQGNDCFRVRQYQDAYRYYTLGLEAASSDAGLNAALYVNRAACSLQLRNYRRCIDDCKRALQHDDSNAKACHRAGQAFMAVDRLDEARQILHYGLAKHPENTALRGLLDQVKQKEEQRDAQTRKKQRLADERAAREKTLARALALRHVEIVHLLHPSEFLDGALVHLESPDDVESQLAFPTMVLYPTLDEFDYVAEVGELTLPLDLLRILLDRPKEWFADPRRKNFTLGSLHCIMETISGGLVKVGKKAAFNTALMATSPKAPLFDNGLRLYVVPSEDFEGWVSTWSKEAALAKRKTEATRKDDEEEG